MAESGTATTTAEQGNRLLFAELRGLSLEDLIALAVTPLLNAEKES